VSRWRPGDSADETLPLWGFFAEKMVKSYNDHEGEFDKEFEDKTDEAIDNNKKWFDDIVKQLHTTCFKFIMGYARIELKFHEAHPK